MMALLILPLINKLLIMIYLYYFFVVVSEVYERVIERNNVTTTFLFTTTTVIRSNLLFPLWLSESLPQRGKRETYVGIYFYKKMRMYYLYVCKTKF